MKSHTKTTVRKRWKTVHHRRLSGWVERLLRERTENTTTGKHYSPVLRQRKLPTGRYATWSILRANIAEMCWPPFSCEYNVHYLIWKMNEFDFELQWNPLVHCGLMGNLRKFVKFQVLIVLHLYNTSVYICMYVYKYYVCKYIAGHLLGNEHREWF